MTDGEATSTSDERTLALLAWLLGIFFSFIPPLVIFLVRRERSRFVGFHALQALLWHVVYLAITTPLFGLFFFAGLTSFVKVVQTQPQEPPLALLAGFAAFWIFALVLGLANLVVQVVMAVKASGGSWAELPLIGKWSRRAAS